jgi:hypothetical protein
LFSLLASSSSSGNFEIGSRHQVRSASKPNRFRSFSARGPEIFTKYPDGIDLDLTGGNHQVKSCKTDLPYPAKRAGYYVVTCAGCGMKLITRTAGRADDPKSVRLACKRKHDA